MSNPCLMAILVGANHPPPYCSVAGVVGMLPTIDGWLVEKLPPFQGRAL